MFFYEETKQDNINTINNLRINQLKKGSIFHLNENTYQFIRIRHIKFYGVTLTYIVADQLLLNDNDETIIINRLIPLDQFNEENLYM